MVLQRLVVRLDGEIVLACLIEDVARGYGALDLGGNCVRSGARRALPGGFVRARSCGARTLL